MLLLLVMWPGSVTLEESRVHGRCHGYPEWIFDDQIYPKEIKKEQDEDRKLVHVFVCPMCMVPLKCWHGFSRTMACTTNRTIPSKVRWHVHVKDKTDKLKKCGVIYHIKCENCKEDYIGETGQTLETRPKEHVTRNSFWLFMNIVLTPDTTLNQTIQRS